VGLNAIKNFSVIDLCYKTSIAQSRIISYWGYCDMNKKMRNPSSNVFEKLVIPIIVAIVTGGTLPWWWPYIKGWKGSSSSWCEQEKIKNMLMKAGPKKPQMMIFLAQKMQSQYNLQKFDCVFNIASTIFNDDITNGHALYYLGEYWRVQAGNHGDDSELCRDRMRDFFFKYLSHEGHLSPSEQSGDGKVCYQRANGYCAERTAYIYHLLAIDYYQQAQEIKDEKYRNQILERLQGFLKKDLEYGGFDQIIPSKVLREQVTKMKGGEVN
jgi:hypothetical protein